jgi:hypothetical protein
MSCMDTDLRIYLQLLVNIRLKFQRGDRLGPSRINYGVPTHKLSILPRSDAAAQES